MKSRAEELSGEEILKPDTRTADATGSSVDLKDVYGCYLVLTAGDITDGTHSFTVEESEDDSDWSEVDSFYLDGSFEDVEDGTNDNSIQIVGYTGVKRYVRVKTSTASTSSGGTYGVSAITVARRV